MKTPKYCVVRFEDGEVDIVRPHFFREADAVKEAQSRALRNADAMYQVCELSPGAAFQAQVVAV